MLEDIGGSDVTSEEDVDMDLGRHNSDMKNEDLRAILSK